MALRPLIPRDRRKSPWDLYLEEEIRYYSLFASKGGEISFEDFVEFADFENKEAILELCAQYNSATPTDTVPATNTNRTTGPGPSDSIGEKRDQESEAHPLDPQQLGLEMPLATAQEGQLHEPQQLGLEVPLETASKVDLASADGTVLSKHKGHTPSWHQRLRMSRVWDVTLGMSPPFLLVISQPNQTKV